MQTNWYEYITRYTRILDAGYELAKGFDHGGLKGDVREYFVEMFLNKLIPESMGVGCGEVIDRDGKKSKQIDLLVYDKKFPVLRLTASQSLFPIESVVATIEIKSTLQGKVSEALDNCKSVTDLHPVVARTPTTEAQLTTGDDKVEWAYPSTYVFAYKGYEGNPRSLKDAVLGWHDATLKKKNATPEKSKSSLNLLEFPRMMVTEGCLAIRSSNDLKLSLDPSGKTQVAFAVKETEFKTQVFVCDLLRTIARRSLFIPNVPGSDFGECRFGMETYFDTKGLITDKVMGNGDSWEYIVRHVI